MWEKILKASYSSKNFKFLKTAMIAQIKDLDIDTEITIPELLNGYINYIDLNERDLVYFNQWWRRKGIDWYTNIFGRIALSNGMVKGNRSRKNSSERSSDNIRHSVFIRDE